MSGPGDPRPGPAVALLAAAVVTDAGWLVLRPHLHGAWTWAPLIAALGVHAAAVGHERRWPSLSPRAVLIATAVVVVVAVALPPFGSRDVYAYAFSGRMVAFHHANPYFLVPNHFRGDPLLRLVAPPWRRVPTVYGPLFTGVSALGALGYGTSALLARLCFQALAGGALLASVWFLARRRVASSILVLVGLAPPMVVAVNGGHNDVVAGSLILAGVLSLDHRSRWRAGGFLAAAILVKLLVVPALACVLVVLALQGRRAVALRAAAVVAVSAVVAYLLAGGPGALRPVTTSARAISRGSWWHEVNRILAGHGSGSVLPALRVQHYALLATVVVGLAFVTRLRLGATPAVAAAGGMLVFLLTSQYVLPWYSALALPVAALAVPRVCWLVQAQATLVLLAYAAPPGQLVAHVPGVEQVTVVGAYLQLGLLVALLFVPLRDGLRPVEALRPGEDPEPPQGVDTATKSRESGVR